MAAEPNFTHADDPVFLLHRGGKIAMHPSVPLAAADALANLTGDDLAPDYVIPGAFDERAAPAVAAAVATQARTEQAART
jgi:malic enzyme